MNVVERNNVHTRGSGVRAMMFAHGFGCDQNMWRFVEAAFETDFRTVLFDQVGAGGSDLQSYDKAKYSTLGGYADDVVEIGRELGLKDAVFVGHSVSAMIGALAVLKAPGMFGKLVMIGPSARYIDDDGYIGGFGASQIESCSSFWKPTTWAVRPDGAGDHGQRRSSGAWRRTDQQLLPDRSRDRQGVRAGHFHVRQSRGPAEDRRSDPDPPVQRGCHRAAGGRRVRPGGDPREPFRDSRRYGPLPESECSGRGDLGYAKLRLNRRVTGPSIHDFEDMFESAPCGYVVLRANSRIDLVNRTMLNWTGHAADRMVGKRFSDFLNTAARVFYETHVAPLLRMQGSFNEFAIDVVDAGGKPIQMIANAVEGRDADGKPLFVRLVLIKATDRRRYEHELLEAREVAKTSLEQERETSELREQFIAVLGHDLRNPLASISAGARILGRDAKTDRDHQIVAMLQSTVIRLAGLIDNVLGFARGRLGGGITLDRNARAPLEPVLHQVVDELRLSSTGRAIVEEYAIDAPVNCDRSRIGQLVSNLVGNSLAYGVSNEPVRIRPATEHGLFRLSVSNGGEPIPAAAMEKLFDPFFRGTVRDSRQGLGLGLHIAAQIAKAHQGTLTVTSTAEQTRFTFEMPLR